MTQADMPEGFAIEAQGAPAPPADKAPCTAENNVDLAKGDTYASGKSMEWTGVSLTIKDKKILDGISGNVNGGEMTCILGPSGAGKSTLLNILAGRMNTKARAMTFSGGVSIGGCIVDPVAVRSTIGYVMQEDAMSAMSTPREILAMSCVLRGSERGSQAVQGRVDSLLATLRLEKCADTRVGNALVKGLSGGEKKRTAVALELITTPSMLFLDEPLSGLDSYAAWMVVQVLKELSSKGCAVLCTIHQPSSEIFQMFNKLICLSDGKTCYCDAVSRLMEHMESIGSPVPNNYNPADHILFYVQTQSKEQIVEFTTTWAEKEKKSTLQQIEDLRSASSANKAAGTSIKGKNCFLQLGFLVQRETRQIYRDKVGLVMRFVVNAVMGTVFAFIFMDIGSKGNEQGGIQGHYGAICNMMISAMFGSAQPLLLTFPQERPIFLREYASNMYGVIPYFLAKTIVEIPLAFLTALESWLIAYWIVGYNGNLFYLTLTGFAMGMTAASTALLIGCSVAHVQTAQELSPLVFVPQILFSGAFVPVALIPKGLQYLQYICALKYAINLCVIVEFEDLPAGRQFLQDTQDINPDDRWLYVGILCTIFVVFRSIAMINLRNRAKFVI